MRDGAENGALSAKAVVDVAMMTASLACLSCLQPSPASRQLSVEPIAPAYGTLLFGFETTPEMRDNI